MTWPPSDTLQPLGDDDATIQITVLRGAAHGLLTVRAKDQDLTADQFAALARAASKAARRLRNAQPRSPQ